MDILPVSIPDLIHARTVESVRIEYKKTWNDVIANSVFRSLCAFANDLTGLNGGYLILGLEEERGAPILPPHGLDDLDVDRVQRELRGQCKARIEPEYYPRIEPVRYEGKMLLVLYAPRGDNRPYKARESGAKGAPYKYYVRINSETVEATGHLDVQLRELTAKIPFDDRRRADVPLSVVSGLLLRQFLLDVRSELAQSGAVPDLQTEDILRRLRLSAGTNGTEAPRNIALLFFTDSPERWFPGAFVEVAHFRDDGGGDLIETKPFRGPLPQQLRSVLDHLDSLSSHVTRKVPGQAQAERFVAFPYDAMREAVVNAVYHRGYDGPDWPVRIGLYPNRLEITSYPGPVPGLERHHLVPGASPPQLPPRNPRVGELLKSLRLAETWHTGIPKIRARMKENGSPEPSFDFDDGRTYFRVTLPAHPGYVTLQALREAAALWHTGERSRAMMLLDTARAAAPGSGTLAAQRIEYAAAGGDLHFAQRILDDLQQAPAARDVHLAREALTRAYLDRGEASRARGLLKDLGEAAPRSAADAVDRAILHKRSGDLEGAHRMFAAVEHEIQGDPKALHELAQVKRGIARSLRGRTHQHVKEQLNREAVRLLRRVIAISTDRTRTAWAWYDLARTLAWLREPESEVRIACEKAIELAPEEPRFRDWLAQRGPAG